MVNLTSLSPAAGLDPKDAIRVEQRLYSHGKKRKKELETCYIFLCFNCKKKEIWGRVYQLPFMTGLCKTCSRGRWTNRPYEAIYRMMLAKGPARGGGQRKDWKFPSFEEFLEFTKTKTCHYCGGEIVWRESTRYKTLKDGKGFGYNLDRVNNDGGYEKENLVVCCTFCNQLKRNLLTYEDMILLRDSGLLQTLKRRYESRKRELVNSAHV